MNVREMVESDFDEVYETFLQGNRLHDSKEGFRPLFSSAWAKQGASPGFVMTDGGRIVGVLGTIFSDRVINGEPERFCNLHTWFVKEEYRGYSLSLMRPITKLKDCTITDLSPSPSVVNISRRLGFSLMDSRLTILLPRKSQSTSELGFFNPAERPELLSAPDRQILDDHAHLPCGTLLVTEFQRLSCLILYRHVSRGFPHCYLHYVSDWEFFREHSIAIRREISLRSECRYIAVNRRVLGPNAVPGSFTLPVRTPQLYKSNKVDPSRIDTLYSEVIINNWSLIPTLKSQARRLAEKCGCLKHCLSLKERARRLLSFRRQPPITIQER